MGIITAVENQIARVFSKPIHDQRLIHEPKPREIRAPQDRRRFVAFAGLLIPAQAGYRIEHEQIVYARIAQVGEPRLHPGRNRLTSRVGEGPCRFEMRDVACCWPAKPDNIRARRPIHPVRVADVGRFGAHHIHPAIAVDVHHDRVGRGDGLASRRCDLDALVEPRVLARADVLVEIQSARRGRS